MPAVIAALLVALITSAHAQQVPQPCIELAARENVPLPTNEAEARAAKIKVIRMFLKGDPLARDCWHAIKRELSK